jgi:hypothetical protein
MTADGGPQTANFHPWLCARAHVVSYENDGGRRTTDGEFLFVVDRLESVKIGVHLRRRLLGGAARSFLLRCELGAMR